MSRIGKQPISLATGTTMTIKGNLVTVKGAKGELKKELALENVKIDVQEKEVTVTRIDDSKKSRAMHGLIRTLLANMVEGVEKGFEKRLEIIGVGFKAAPNKNKIKLNLGFSHPIELTMDSSIEMTMDKDAKNTIIIKGLDKQIVGQAAATIRSQKKPEPYKGKGIRYVGEYVRRKAGKTSAS